MAYTDYIRQTPEGYIRVVNSADYDSIVSYIQLPDITVFVDAVVNLPNTVQATFKSGKVETMIIKWERVNVDTSTAGTQKIYGDIGNGAAAVLQNVIVEENLTDLDILRQIRDANPASQLPSLWLDSGDPYTQWEGVTWNGTNTKVIELDVKSTDVITLTNVNKLNDLQGLYCPYNQLTELNVIGLTSLQYLLCYNNQITSLDVTGLIALQNLECNYNQLTSLDVTGLINLQVLVGYYNQLTSIPSLTSKSYITTYDFTYNNFPTAELDRLRALGFTDESKLLPQNP